jgi:hypothetical protein
MLKPRYNPAQMLRLLHQTNYYRELFVPPRPTLTPATYIPPTFPADDVSYVSASWFIQRLSSDKSFWEPFEPALLNIPPPTNKPNNTTTKRGVIEIQENIKGLAYTMASVMPWRNSLSTATEAKTHAGAIVSQLARIVRDWRIVDEMFADEARTIAAVEKVKNGVDMKEEYGEYWAAHVLCGMIFQWCDMCMKRIESEDLREIWKQSCPTWRLIAEAVKRQLEQLEVKAAHTTVEKQAAAVSRKKMRKFQ